MATAWKVAAATAVIGWLVSPIISLLLPKIISLLGFDASEKLEQLEIHIIPELLQVLRAVDQERMMDRAKKVKNDVAALDKMAAMLRHAREDAEDIFDDAQEKIVSSDILYCAVKSCVTLCLSIARLGRTRSARLLKWAGNWFLLRRRLEELVPENIIAAASDEPAPVTIDVAATNEQAVSVDVSSVLDDPLPVTAPSYSSFDVFKNRFVESFEAACFCRNWSYEVVGITCNENNHNVLDVVLTGVSRRNLKKRIEKVESTISEVKKSTLLGVASKSEPEVIANKNRSMIRTASNFKVFGRETLRDAIMKKLRDIPHGDVSSLSTVPCYSTIGIYGVAGSGKTTFARYIRDYIKDECKEEKLFDTIMCIHVSETFSVDVIFHEMLKDITKNPHSDISDHDVLGDKLKESLEGKRFFLILDDVWVKNRSNLQLQELLSPLEVGKEGSKVLVTARTKDATRAICADAPMEMPDLDEEQYFSMFMHYALGGTVVADEELISVGREIAKKLHRSPIAAAIVAGRLGTDTNVGFWKNTAKLDMSNGTMNVLWWSYQQLSPDIRRCFEYCNIFPRRIGVRECDLIRLWTTQGFIKTNCATEHMDDVALRYIQVLLSCSFLQPEMDIKGRDIGCFIIHDLLHDLLDKVTGNDCFRIENVGSQRGEGWKGHVPRDVRNLFVQKYDAKLITEKILGLKSLRSLIIYFVGEDTTVEGKVIESICKRLPRLRVLAVSFSKGHSKFRQPNDIFLVPESISQLKHIRYFSFNTRSKLILASTVNKLRHIQLLDFGCGKFLEFPIAELITLRHLILQGPYMVSLKNIGRLTSLQTIPEFRVRNEQGYELKQLRDLNKLDSLLIDGLHNVKSKEEALEANLAAKERLTVLHLDWYVYFRGTRCSPEIQEEVLEGLCPPVGLKELAIWRYRGLRYPDWMIRNQNGSPKNLHRLEFWENELGITFELAGAFPHLRVLGLYHCTWDTLPINMEHLTSLKEIVIQFCKNIRSLPILPQSLEWIFLAKCDDEFIKSCQTVGHPNWQNIQHIRHKEILH